MRRLEGAFIFLSLLVTSACAGDDAGGQTAGTSSESSGSTGATETGATETNATETDESSTETGDASCWDSMHAIVTDIDETLTTADSEFLMQLMDSTYDPLERAEGSEMINDYHARGYTIIYLTARAESQFSIDNMTPARDLTEAWLVDHGFPMDENTQLILAPGFVIGDETAMYKGQALIDLQAEGYTFDYAYGNAITDIDGYEMAGIPKEVTFIIGVEAGMDGTVPILEEDWVTHRAAQIPMVPNYCEG
jgi:phosphatidate phosphatase PAH1